LGEGVVYDSELYLAELVVAHRCVILEELQALLYLVMVRKFALNEGFLAVGLCIDVCRSDLLAVGAQVLEQTVHHRVIRLKTVQQSSQGKLFLIFFVRGVILCFRSRSTYTVVVIDGLLLCNGFIRVASDDGASGSDVRVGCLRLIRCRCGGFFSIGTIREAILVVLYQSSEES